MVTLEWSHWFVSLEWEWKRIKINDGMELLSAAGPSNSSYNIFSILSSSPLSFHLDLDWMNCWKKWSNEWKENQIKRRKRRAGFALSLILSSFSAAPSLTPSKGAKRRAATFWLELSCFLFLVFEWIMSEAPLPQMNFIPLIQQLTSFHHLCLHQSNERRKNQQ